MPRPGWSPSTVPYGADETVYLIIDRFHHRPLSQRRRVPRDRDRTNRPRNHHSDLLAGQFNDPVRVVAFNTLEHWADDVSADIAAEIQTRCDIQGESVPRSFVGSRPELFGFKPAVDLPVGLSEERTSLRAGRASSTIRSYCRMGACC
jgi:hypothetical protein